MDRLPVTIPGKLLAVSEPDYEHLMLMTGQVRSYNKVVEGSGRLMVTLFVQSMAETRENDTMNKVTLVGVLCKPPIYRSTPFGREICDMMLAVTIAASAPVAAMVSMFAEKFRRDVDVAVAVVSGSTILSIVTMPVIIALAMAVL